MNTDIIHKGMITKGYKHTCTLLGEDYKGTNKKGIEYQKREWKRYFNWIEHTSYRWEVTEVYSYSKSKVDKRVNNTGANNNKFSIHLEKLIPCLIQREGGRLSMTRSRLLEELGFVNEKCETLNYNIGRISKTVGVPVKYIYEFKDILKEVSKAVDRCIVKLQEREIVDCVKEMVIKIFNGDTVVMNEQQHKVCESCSDDIIARMGYKSLTDCFNNGGLNEYTQRLRIELRSKLGINVDYVFNVVTMVSVRDIGEYDDCEYDYENEIRMLNQKVIHSVMSKVEKRHKKVNIGGGKVIFGEMNVPEGRDRLYYGEDCISVFVKLCDEYIRIE